MTGTILLCLFHPVKVDEGELGIALIDGEDAFDVDLGSGEDGRVDLGVGEAGVAAGADLNILAAHLEILAH